MDLLTQLNNAMAYIEAHIDDDLVLTDVATVTGYSSYHFGRLFYYITDMPLSEYIRRRKLSLAAIKLQNSGVKVIDLAVQYGYDSADSFTRAFAKQHGVTPSAARQTGVSLTVFPPLTFQIKIKGVQSMNWRIEKLEAFEVFGVERIFGNDESDKVPGFWSELKATGEYERLFQAAGAKRGEGGKHCINALCGYSEPDGDVFPYMVCALKKADSDSTGFKTAQVPAATWAVFRADSSYDGAEIPNLFSRAHSEWLPSSGYNKAIGPDMEIYYTTEDGKHFEEVWIPVKKF
ncbi:MAG: AraC family transcriptional regulator [Oscillospiraceae bacterium]|jgi:AraC family transcriptional regulator|nr:AraC family transcriptional regulator [Oscillospiraceae bacterium]